MPYYDNPAGRLHDLLRKLTEQNGRTSLLNAWAHVLRVDENDVVLHLGRVADLVRQTQRAVDRAGEDALLPPVQRYRAVWTRPIFPPDQAYNNALQSVLPDGPALEALELVSAQLHAIAPDGVVPDEDQLDALKAQLRDLIDAVSEADDVPDEVKHLVVVRLRDVEEAIQHLDIGGPEAIRRATEAVMGGVLFTQNANVASSQTVRKVWTTLLAIWVVFSAGPTIQASIEAWQHIIPALQAPSSSSHDEHEAAQPHRDDPGPARDRPQPERN